MICMPVMNRTVNTLKKEMAAKKTCKYGVCWKKARPNSGRRWSANVNKKKVKKANQASLLSVESSHNSKTKEIIELKDRWVKVGVTMDSGAAGQVIPETMFPRVKLERKISPKKFVAANGE